ncbi:MAG: DUF3850 domain-containing protein [Lactococcus lactis]
MKTHELKLDIKYFDDVKSGKKNFEIRKNDRYFQVDNILELKAYDARVGYMKMDTKTLLDEHYAEFEKTAWFKAKNSKSADTIKVKVIDIIPPKTWWSILNKFGINNGPVMTKSGFLFLPKEVLTVLEDYFSTDRLPDNYVILGIEAVEG